MKTLFGIAQNAERSHICIAVSVYILAAIVKLTITHK